MRRARATAALAAIAALAAAAAAGCAATPPATPPSPHAVESERLREVMGELDRLRSARLPQELDTERERRRQAEALAATARALARTSAEIGGAAPLADLEPAERAEFERLAAELRARTERLAADAPSLDAAALDARLAELDATCGACHQRFRRR